MNQEKTGGFAFAMLDPNGTYSQYGMVLLDFFAAKAMVALMGRSKGLDMQEVAARSYEQAAAMLEARKQYMQ